MVVEPVEQGAPQVGERLRQIRRQQGLSLQDVEARTRKEFKASVLGAYERGERTISVPRLMRLAQIYTVPPDQLLPRGMDGSITERASGPVTDGFTVDLVRLGELDNPDSQVLARYVATIQLQRQDFNGRMLTIRRDDLRVLAAVVGRTPDELIDRLDELGLRASI
jgi:transcriptional regulator with XRE-family HTH domain